MNDNDETDSEWDSTLDFTSPRQTADKQLRPPEIEDEDASRQDSIKDKPKPKERTTLPVSQYHLHASFSNIFSWKCINICILMMHIDPGIPYQTWYNEH